MIFYEDVKLESTEKYFNNNKFSIDAFNNKYKLENSDETYIKALKRVCDGIASVEKTKKMQKYWSERWFDEIYNDWWHPAGSIMQGVGSGKKISIANCTHISMGNINLDEEWDNLESILKNTTYDVVKSAAYRQGLGFDISRLRPRGTTVQNSSKESTGSIHWAQFIDSTAYYCGQRGRIPAYLISLNIKHPDIEEFITIKSDYTKIQNANISVQITNSFYTAVEKDEDWQLLFEIPEIKKGQKVFIDEHSITKDSKYDSKKKKWYYIASHNRPYEKFEKTVKAKYLLELISKNMFVNAEPGIQNIDIARKYSNSDYVYDLNDEYDSRIQGTNACSEQYLSRNSLCVLSSINMGNFSIDENEYKKELEKIGESINRFLDNVNEYELKYKTYATPHQKIAIEKLRRTGAGYTNMGAWLFKLNLEYGSAISNEKVAEFTKWYNYYLYKSSIKLGKEKGNFGLFNKEKFIKSPFIKRMMVEFPDLNFDTMRNVTCSSIAPTGTLSLMFRDMVMSYGIEPSFGLYYWKRTRISGKYTYYFCVPNIVRKVFKDNGLEIPILSDTINDTWDGKYGKEISEFIDNNKKRLQIKFKNATEISPFDKLELMSKVQKYIDSSISVTYLLSEDSKWEDVYKFIIEAYKKDVKSISAFPDKKMYGIISFIPFRDLAFKLKSENIQIHSQNFSEDELKELKLSNDYITFTSAPKRPVSLDADIYSIIVKGEKFVIVVGLLNGVPYEVFGGHMNGLNFKFKEKKGKIEKVKSGIYKLEIGEDFIVENFSEQFTPVEQILFRLISTSLRHGSPIKFIVEQLSKSTDDITSLTSAISRVLKKYIKNGELVFGKKCPSCGNINLIYIDGCVSCSCGWSKCL